MWAREGGSKDGKDECRGRENGKEIGSGRGRNSVKEEKYKKGETEKESVRRQRKEESIRQEKIWK